MLICTVESNVFSNAMNWLATPNSHIYLLEIFVWVYINFLLLLVLPKLPVSSWLTYRPWIFLGFLIIPSWVFIFIEWQRWWLHLSLLRVMSAARQLQSRHAGILLLRMFGLFNAATATCSFPNMNCTLVRWFGKRPFIFRWGLMLWLGYDRLSPCQICFALAWKEWIQLRTQICINLSAFSRKHQGCVGSDRPEVYTGEDRKFAARYMRWMHVRRLRFNWGHASSRQITWPL